MKINIYALLAASVFLLSLFFPWLSYSFSAFGSQPLLNVFSVNYSPFRETASAVVYNSTSFQTLGYYGPESWSPKPFLDRPLWTTLNTYFLSVTAVALLFIFAAALMIHVSFASGSWNGVGRKIAIAASNLSFLMIFLYLIIVCRYIEIGGQALNGGQNGWLLARQTQSFVPFLDIGFWLAILGSVAAYVSWLHPKFIHIETKIWNGKIEALKRLLPVSEWQKTAVVATSSFLIIFVFTIIYLFLTPGTF
jgi:hypothetical protein